MYFLARIIAAHARQGAPRGDQLLIKFLTFHMDSLKVEQIWDLMDEPMKRKGRTPNDLAHETLERIENNPSKAERFLEILLHVAPYLGQGIFSSQMDMIRKELLSGYTLSDPPFLEKDAPLTAKAVEKIEAFIPVVFQTGRELDFFLKSSLDFRVKKTFEPYPKEEFPKKFTKWLTWNLNFLAPIKKALLNHFKGRKWDIELAFPG